MKTALKVGDSVRLKGFAGFKGKSIDVEGERGLISGEAKSVGLFLVDVGEHRGVVYPSQCRRIRKKKRGEIWVNEYKGKCFWAYDTKKEADKGDPGRISCDRYIKARR